MMYRISSNKRRVSNKRLLLVNGVEIIRNLAKTKYHNGNYLLLLGKGKLQNFEVSYE